MTALRRARSVDTLAYRLFIISRHQVHGVGDQADQRCPVDQGDRRGKQGISEANSAPPKTVSKMMSAAITPTATDRLGPELS